jgi:hypothetical protein
MMSKISRGCQHSLIAMAVEIVVSGTALAQVAPIAAPEVTPVVAVTGAQINNFVSYQTDLRIMGPRLRGRLEREILTGRHKEDDHHAV